MLHWWVMNTARLGGPLDTSAPSLEPDRAWQRAGGGAVGSGPFSGEFIRFWIRDWIEADLERKLREPGYFLRISAS